MKEKRARTNYSVAYKMSVVEELENGYLTLKEAERLYGLSSSTVSDWIRKYGINERINRQVHIMTNQEGNALIQLRKENKMLRRAMEDSQIKTIILETLIDLANKEYDTDLKKNLNTAALEKVKEKLRLQETELD